MRRSFSIAACVVAALIASYVQAFPRAWYVKVDGSGDAPTIQAAVDSVSQDDTILVGPGTYTWNNQGGRVEGMIFIPRGTPDFCLLGEAGRGMTTLDAQGQGRILAHEAETGLVIDGFTFRNGVGTSWPGTTFAGGAIWSHLAFPVVRNCNFRFNSGTPGGAIFYGGIGAVTIENCVFAYNEAANQGGAMWIGSGSTAAAYENRITRCTFRDNSVTTANLNGGGAILVAQSLVTIDRCSFYRNTSAGPGGAIYTKLGVTGTIQSCTLGENEASAGSAFYSNGNTMMSLENCILSQNVGDPVHLEPTDAVTLTCCDVWGNVPGDWTGGIAGQNGQNGNFTANPRFCPASEGLFGLAADSPCAPGNHPDAVDCGVIGRRQVVCGAVPAERRSWGGIKALFDDGG